MAQFRLYLFGSPRLERDGKPLEIRLRKALALFVYLSVTRQGHSRDALATLFWPEKDQQSARANLRRTLYDLNQLLGERLLAITDEMVALEDASALWLDTEAFQHCLADCLPATLAGQDQNADTVLTLVQAADLYTDDFLTGFTLPDCPEFDEWQFFQREELRSAYARLLQQLVAIYEAQEQFEETVRYARRWLQLDPLEESVHRHLMRFYAQAGQWAMALRQYEECVRILDAELAVPPATETTTLYQAIRARRFPADKPANRPGDKAIVDAIIDNVTSGQVTEDHPITASSPRPVTWSPSLPVGASPHQLPTPPTPFLGRSQELGDLLAHLQDPACRLLTLVGPGGIGKTRLALEVARLLAEGQGSPHAYADGIFFVSLQSVSTVSGVATAIVEILGLHIDGDAANQQLLVDALRHKQLLVVLDNFEHLLAATDLIADLLASAPNLKLLVTSREPLVLQEAWFYPIAGMSYPQAAVNPLEALTDFDAIRFFVQCARPVRNSFALADEQEQVVRICRLVGGAPLALELAAGWLTGLSCRQIADEIEQSLDILTARQPTAVARHRSMRAVLEQSWQQLPAAERTLLCKLTVFQGGCLHPVAEHVAGANSLLLTALAEKALLYFTHGDRYMLHELVRHFAEEQWQSAPAEQVLTRARHSAYYLALLEQHTPNLKGNQQKEAFAAIRAELANIRTAWRYAVLHNDVPALTSAAEGLWVFSDASGTFREAESAFQQAIDALFTARSNGDWTPAQQALVGFLLAGQGYLCYRRGVAQSGRDLMEQGIALLRQVRPPALRPLAMALLYLGWLVGNQHEEAQQLAQESMALFSAAADRWGIVACKELWANIAMQTQPLVDVQQLLQEGLALSAAISAHKLRGGFLQKLGEIALWLGNYAQAQQCLEEALVIGHEIGTRPGLTNILRDLSRLAVQQGHYEQAFQILQECLVIAEGIGPQWTTRSMLATLAEVCRLLGKPKDAEQHYQHCLHAAQANAKSSIIATVLSGLGVLALTQGNFSLAEQRQQQALALWRQFKREPEIASVLRHLGHLLVADGASRQQEIGQYYGEALQLAIKHGLAPVALDILVGAARLKTGANVTSRDLERLSLASQHSAATYETRENARRQLVELAATTDIEQRTPSHSPPLAWQSLAQRLVEDLANPARVQRGAVPHNLIPPPTPFVGRAHELNEISHSLRTPACRLLTIVGPGGIGKTRLVQQAAQIIVDSLDADGESGNPLFPDGIFFVPLQAVETTSSAVDAIASVTDFRFYSDIPQRQQLVDFLAEKEMLLLLDNMEQVVDGASLVAEILTQAPFVKLLVTSHRALNLQEEWFYPLTGMTLPHLDHQQSQFVTTYDIDKNNIEADAVQLFVQCALRARADFTLDSEFEQVMRICRLVDGMPLALELAASWVKALSCRQIAGEIESSLDILTIRHENIPLRHRSIQAVLEQSWQKILDEAEQTALKHLAVFRGGFAYEAAQTAANASFLTLATLVEKALIWVTPAGRYHMHELLRHFAAARLSAEPATEATIRQQHSHYYLHFLLTREQEVVGKKQQQTLDELTVELENILEAWRWAVQQNDWTTINQATEALFWYYLMRHRCAEGENVFAQTVAKLEASLAISDDSALALLRAIMLRKAAVFNFFLGDYAIARMRLEESLAVARRLQRPQEVAHALNVLGVLVGWQGEQTVGIAHLRECLALAQELGDRQTAADALHELGQLFAHAGEFATAKALTQQGLTLCRQLERLDWTAHALDTLGWTTFCLGEYQEAERHYRESLAIFQDLGHKLGISLALGGLGLVAWAGGGEQLPTAARLTAESLALCRTIGNRLHCANHLADLAQIACELGDYTQALTHGQEGLVIAQAVGSPIFAIYNLCALGRASCQLGDWTTSRTYLVQAIQTAQEAHLQAAVVIALFHYAVLLCGESQNVNAPVQQTKQRQALEFLGVISAHPACWHIYRERAVALQATLIVQTGETERTPQEQSVEELAATLLTEDQFSAIRCSPAGSHPIVGTDSVP